MSTTETCHVNIFDRNFHIICPEEELSSLYESATYLDRKMRNISNKTKIMGLDQLAIITALNIIHDFFNKKNSQAISEIDDRLQSLCHDIELVLNVDE